MSRSPLLSTGLVFLLVNSATADDKSAKGELQKFQGTWAGTSTFGGQPLQMAVTVKEDSWTFENTRPNGAKITGSCKFAINEKAIPVKTIDLIGLVRRTARGDSNPETQLAIYEFLDDDTLKICNGGNERPAEFKEGIDGGRPKLFTLKRSR